MADFIGENLAGSRFERADLNGSQFREVDLSGSRFRNIDLRRSVLRGLWLADVEIDGLTETLRHLVFATDVWIRRAVHGDPAPWDPLGLPGDELPDTRGVPNDHSARPSLEKVLALRRDRMATVRQLVDGLTSASLDTRTEPVDAPGWPPPRSYPVRECLQVVLNEEWEHRRFAERDLAVLEAREQGDADGRSLPA